MKKFIIHTNKNSSDFGWHLFKGIKSDVPEIVKHFLSNERGKSFEIVPNPRHSNNGLGHRFDATNPEECAIAQQKHIEYIENDNLKKLKETLAFYNGTRADVTQIKEDIKECEKEISDYASIPATEIPHYPQENSVLIYCEDNIPEGLLDKAKIFIEKYASLNEIEIETYELLDVVEDESSVKEIKVRVTAYKENIIIETVNPDIFDKDFLPNGNGRIGCHISDPEKLGISPEAYELLQKIKKCRDAIGDFMWDNNNFGWIGGVVAIKDLNSVGARDYSTNNDFIEIENEVPQGAIDSIEEGIKNIEEGNNKVEYDDILFEPWLEFREDRTYNHETSSYDSKDIYNVTICFHDAHIYDTEVEVVNAPEEYIEKGEEGYTDIKFPKEIRYQIEEKISSFLGKEYTKPKPVKESWLFKSMKERLEEDNGKEVTDEEVLEYIKPLNRDDRSTMNFTVTKEELMPIINSLFDLGFYNNIMYPHSDYWRMCRRDTAKGFLELLNDFKLIP